MNRPIAISLSPNTEKDDVALAFRMISSPSTWFDATKTQKLEKEFAGKFGKGYKAIAVNSGRSALYLILKVLGIGKGDEIALQALTCVAVPNSVLWLGAKPLYIDVDKSFNMNPVDLKNKITKNTKAIIIQHSFGIPADINHLLQISKKKGIIVIEDCALSLGAKYNGKPVGTLGDISFFSFGRDKVISSVFGGMILCKDNGIYKELLKERDNLQFPGNIWVIRQLMHPILFRMILPVYNFGIGKYSLGKLMLFLFQKIGLMSKAIYEEEKKGIKPDIFPAKLPGALSVLALNQLVKVDRFNAHRREIADIYFKELENFGYVIPPKKKDAIWVRFPIYKAQAGKIYESSKKKGVLLGNWYKRVVDPVEDLSFVGYKKGSCPEAEMFSGNIINLPTYPTLTKEQARLVIHLIK